MKKFTTNYTDTNPNFAIQNLSANQTNANMFKILCVTKNNLTKQI